MDTWTKQPGYPFLEVSQSQGEDGQPALVLRQRRFLYDRDPAHDEEDQSLWRIPIGVRGAAAATAFLTMLEAREATVPLPEAFSGANGAGWLKLNAAQTGYFRVNYSPELWARLRPAIEARALPTADRLGLQADAFALMRGGYLPATQFLSLAQAYTQEREYPVWSDLAGNLGWISDLVAQEPYDPYFKAFARELLRPIVQQMGWDPQPSESHLDALLRGTVIHELGHYEEASLLQEARSRFARFVRDPQALHPDLRSAVLNLAAFGGDHATYQDLRDIERKATLQEEKLRALTALTHFPQRELLQAALDLSLSPDVRSQDTVRMVAGIAANTSGRELAWEFTRANWAEFDRRYGGGGFLLTRLIESVTSHFTTLERAQEVAEFFQAHPVPSATRTIQQSLERIRINARWLAQNRDPLATWLQGAS
jgi:puromycin-sensitive aminopeptidase